MELGEKLKMSRKKKGYSQGEVAEKLHISRQAVSKWETGQNLPDVGKLTELAELYAVPVAFLLGEKQNEPETEVVLPEKEEDSVVMPALKKHNEMVENVLLMILMIVSCVIPFFGIVIPLIVIYLNKGKRQFRFVLIILGICCCLISIYNSALILNTWFFDFGFDYNVKKIK